MSLMDEVKALRHRRRLKPWTRANALRRIYETNLLFVHIPKCGGKSVIRDLYRLEDTRWFGHADVETFRYILGPRRFDAVHKVTFVRDPVERCISGFRFEKTGGFQGKGGLRLQALLRELDFESFVLDGHLEEIMGWSIVFRPQVSFLRNAQGEIAVNQICRFSNFSEELHRLQMRLYGNSEMSHQNRSESARPTEVSEKARDRIRQLYAVDYEAFGGRF